MGEKPYQPMPAPKPTPVPQPMPHPPMRPGYPIAPQPYMPCDEKMLRRLYHHLKMCHRHEMKMLKMMMRHCKHTSRKKRRGCHESPYYRESSSHHCESSSYHRPNHLCDPCESPSHHRNNSHHESSSSAYHR